MQVNNSIHYSSDPYLLSKYLHKNEDKAELSSERGSESTVDITADRLEEKLYAKSINAAPSVAASEQNRSDTTGSNSSAQQAIFAYTEVENSTSSQAFNQLQEIV